MWMPLSASATAIPLPMPREAPVIKACFVTCAMLSLLGRARRGPSSPGARPTQCVSRLWRRPCLTARSPVIRHVTPQGPFIADSRARLTVRKWPVSDRAPAADPRSPLHFRLFGHLECVIDLDAEVSNGALELRMTEQELHCTQILPAAGTRRPARRAQRCPRHRHAAADPAPGAVRSYPANTRIPC